MLSLKRALLTTLSSFLLLAASVSAQDNLKASSNTKAPLDKYQWTYDTDPYGSEAIINEKLIRHGGIWIKFKRVARISDERNSWTELIYKIPTASLVSTQKIRLTYQSEIPLLVTLPQQEYGKNGDQSKAYYQGELPASKQWVTKEVSIKNFKRPHWTPQESKDLGLLPEHIKTINFVPKLTDEKGGEAIIQVRAIELLP